MHYAEICDVEVMKLIVRFDLQQNDVYWSKQKYKTNNFVSNLVWNTRFFPIKQKPNTQNTIYNARLQIAITFIWIIPLEPASNWRYVKQTLVNKF